MDEIDPPCSDRSWIRYPAGVGPFCVESTCSPRVCVGSLWVLLLPPTVQTHAGYLETLNSLYV